MSDTDETANQELEPNLEEPEVEETPDVEDTSILKENFQKALSQKKRWREKALDPKSGKTYKELYEQKATDEPKVAKEPELTAADVPNISPVDVLNLQSKGYGNEEILLLNKYSQRLKMSIDEVVEDPLVKSGIEAMRYQRKVEQVTPAPTRRTTIKGKPIEKLTPQEREKELGFTNWKSRKVSGE